MSLPPLLTERRPAALAVAFASIFVLSAGADAAPPSSGDDSGDEPLSTIERRLGEPQDGFPNYQERVALYLTNRARVEPEAFNSEDPYPPSAPLRFDVDLAKAARWQARHIVQASCWCQDHSSCCDVGQQNGEVQCLNAAGACGQTSAEERVTLFSNNYTGENAAYGHQTAPEAIDGWIHSPGHWANINTASHTSLGTGFYAGEGSYSPGWIQVFGSGGTRPVAGDGIHFSSGTGSATRFGITYYQPDTGGPQEIMAVVDREGEKCHDLELSYGEAERGAFETSLTLASGCHRYYFHVTDGDGEYHTYPSEGSLGVAAGNAGDCPLYSRNRPAAACSPTGQTCETGHTRSCYTGPYATEGVGICERGTERCIGGSWTGECRHDVTPEAEEICGNGRDDDCDGETDESCGGADAGMADAGPALGSDDDADDDTATCSLSSVHDSPPRSLWFLLLAAAGLLVRHTRRRAASDGGSNRTKG